ncbi:MAG: SDR family NAD(P)-dependent oxidoreductase [Rickettsiales bacterium]|nr:SDR family NAD(P)-dependent oxidoreductase [Rickettsiales bacterium]
MSNDLNIVVIGASGALGFEFVKQFGGDKNVKNVFAFSRSKIAFDNDKIIADFIDIEDEKSIQEAAQKCPNKIDLVIVATGILHDEKLMPEKSLRDLNKEKFEKLFSVNTIGPALIAKYFLAKLNKEQKSVFAAISARVGSISDNHLGGWYAYRASKTALNMVLKNAAIETARSNKKAIILGLHPGTVDSKLSKPFQSAVKADKLFSPQYSVEKMREVLEKSTISDSGSVIDFNNIKIEC